MCFDINKFYLDTPLMEDPEYVRIKLTDIPQEFIDEYNLTKFERAGWIYFTTICSCYGLKQSVKLSNDLLRTRMEDEDYYKTVTIPGLWRHKWQLIQFVLVVDDFGVEYVGKERALQLPQNLRRLVGRQKIYGHILGVELRQGQHRQDMPPFNKRLHCRPSSHAGTH